MWLRVSEDLVYQSIYILENLIIAKVDSTENEIEGI